MEEGRQDLIIQYVLGELEGVALRKAEQLVESDVQARAFAVQTSETLGALSLAHAKMAPPGLAERVLASGKSRRR